jgi:hypothetical protein
VNNPVTIADRIDELAQQHGGLRAAAREVDCDAAYLYRLRRSEKSAPSDKVLAKLGLKRVVTYVREE